ncbi:MAG: asparagine synthase-related protein [Pseudomonadota bacterium]
MRLICGFWHLDGRPAEIDRLNVMVKAMVANDLKPRVRHEIDGSRAIAMLDFTERYADGNTRSALPKGPSGLTLAADVRLDERATENDDQHLIALLERDGADGIRQAVGDYAFAAWDPATRSFLCARDAMGIRPFFYAYLPGNIFVFASLPSGLHAAGAIERSLDQEHFVNEIIINHCTYTRSFFLGVERLAPGSWLRVTEKGIEKGTHWHLDPAVAGSNPMTPEDAAAQLAALITEAIRCRLPAQGPVAAHLSGGMDSASISILAAQMLRPQGRSLLAYSFVPNFFGGMEPADKNPYIETVLRQEPNITWCPMSIDDPLSYLLPRMSQDQPLPDDPADPDVRAFMQASARGAQIFFSGWGGDEGASFNGRGVLAEAVLAGYWRYLSRELQALAAHSGLSLLQVGWGEIAPYLLPPSVLASVRKLRRRALVPPVIESMRAFLRSEVTQGAPAQLPNFVTYGQHNQRLKLLTNPGLSRRTENWAITGARFGIAAAFPLLDRRVVEFAFSLPGNLFLCHGLRRKVYRDAMKGILPEEVRLKPSKVDSCLDTPPVIGHREKLLERLADFRTHARAAHLFDLDVAERELRNLNFVEKSVATAGKVIGDGTTNAKALVLFRTFRYAAYIQQHH